MFNTVINKVSLYLKVSIKIKRKNR